MPRFLNQLHSEHRSIAAVLHGMRYLIDAQRTRGKQVDLEVFRAMLYYLDVFPERHHHPKEEQFLFAAIREKADGVPKVLDELREDHERGERAIRDLEQALVRYEAGGAAEFPAFAAAADRFVERYFEHMRREEAEVMPLAERLLDRGDWDRVEAAFRAHADPLAGADADDPQKLFSRIVSLAPAPIGLGEAL